MAPLEALISSSPFGYRVSPLTGTGGDFHLGQDFAAVCGTRVYSADAGVVRAAGWHQWGGGNRVEIDHGNGLITTYNHLEAIAVRTGDSVEVGQDIARVGTTGWSTGCHLHFETILHGRHTSPLNWTLLPIHQLDELEDTAMFSYEGRGTDAVGAQRWAIPVAADNSHAVLGGEEELSEAPIPDDTFPPPSVEQTESTEQTGPTQAPPSDTTTPTTTAAPVATEPATATAAATPSAPSTSSTAAPTPSDTPTGSAAPAENPAEDTPAPTASPEPALETTTESSTATTVPTEASTDAVSTTTPAPTATEPSPTAS